MKDPEIPQKRVGTFIAIRDGRVALISGDFFTRGGYSNYARSRAQGLGRPR